MPGTQEFGEVFYVLADLIVASYDSAADTFGTPVALAEGQQLLVEPEGDTDQLRGYGAIVETLSIPTGAKLTLSAGALDRSAFRILTDWYDQTSASTPNRVVTVDLKMGADGALPNFGAIGLAVTAQGGRIAVGVQKCRLNMQPKFTLDGQANKFVIQEIEGFASPVTRNSVQQGIRLKIYETASDWTAPANAADFKAFFTAPAVA